MSQQLLVLSAKCDDLDLILGTNVVEGKKRRPRAVV